MSATDIALTPDFIAHVDSALESAADDVDALTHRRFWNSLTTVYYDWPNFQRAYPWRIWFDESELAEVTVNVPVLKTGVAGGTKTGTVIPNTAVFWGSGQYSPPYRWLELDRSQSYSFGTGVTPQRDVSLLGLVGYWDKQAVAGTLAAAMSDTSSTTATVSNSFALGVGDVIIVDSERMLVRDSAWVTTGQTQSGSGATTASMADNLLTVGSGSALTAGEVLQLDAEQMLALSITGNVVTVQRAYGGTVLATHSNATVYAQRLLTVSRGDFGSTAATHNNSATVNVQVIPGMVRELAIAEALNYVYQKTTAYARQMGAGSGPVMPGGSLPDLRKRVEGSKFTRKLRRRSV
jgi:hypothetical protein